MRPALFQTRLTSLFGIRHPILCGGLMWLSNAEYVAASVRAGAMGFLTARSCADADALRLEIRRCRALCDGLPFGVNLYLSSRPAENAALGAYVDVLIDEGVRFVETAGMSPAALLPRLRAAGCVIIHKVSSLRHALAAEKAGVDAVSIVGMECGGHPGEAMIGSMVQGALGASRLSVPVALGGGIGSGRQLVAALGLGAEAVLMGTRMLVADEIWAHADYKRRVTEMSEVDTRLVLGSFRNAYRAMDNEATRRVAEMETAGIADFAAYRALVSGQAQHQAYASGDWNQGVLSVGQAVAFANAAQPVETIIDELIDEARSASNAFNQKQIQ